MTECNPEARAGAISAQDAEHLNLIRQNVRYFLRRVGEQYGCCGPAKLLDIAPQDHEGARPFFPDSVDVETLDINPSAGTTYVGDICQHNTVLADNSFDFIVCTEVLEHTLQPFSAVVELRRLLRPGGFLFLTVPFNFRIHGPLPDCWRFTEHGLRVLFDKWELVELARFETPNRFLMPVHYTLIARKPER
jgi:SAM-dependent methyltransferase